VRVDFVGRHSELRILGDRLAAAEMGHPQAGRPTPAGRGS
jgi:hypothetical protein